MTLLLLLEFRRHRLLISAWTVLLVALSGGTLSAYQSTYTTPEQRRAATELAQHNAATTMMYGHLAQPGTPAAMFTWEAGAIATILAAVGAVLLAVAVTRSPEDEGTLELVRAAGVDPRSPLRNAVAVLGVVSVIIATGCGLAVGLQVGRVDAVTWAGAMEYGSVVGLTYLLVGTVTVVLAQIAPTAGQARLLGFIAVGGAFALRAFGDTRDIAGLSWLSPLGLRATVRPFDGDRWWVLLVYLAVAAMLVRLAVALSARREYGAGLLRRRNTSDARLEVHSGLRLTAHLARGSVLTWAVGIACVGVLFSAMGSGVVQQSQGDDLGGFLGSQLGRGDLTAGYFAYTGTVVGMLACSYAVLSVLKALHDETAGRTDHVLAVGVRRWAPLAWQLVVIAVASLGILVCTGALSALTGSQLIGGADVAARAFTYVVGQWPAAVAAAGWTALVVGLRPRLSALAWLPLLLSGVLSLLGPLLGVPQRLQDVGFFGHVPDIASTRPDTSGLLVMLVVAGSTSALGLAAIAHRDL